MRHGVKRPGSCRRLKFEWLERAVRERDVQATCLLEAWGTRDVEAKPMTPSTIFRMYSMTKPITGADVMTPVDAGKISLDDPASKHITEFKDMKVLIEKRDGSTELVPAERPIMLKHLMTHTDDPAKSPFLKVPSLDEGGGGLVCTAADYLRLAQMLLNGENWMASAF